MNREPARKAADKLYARMIAQVVRAVGPFLGLPVNTSTNQALAKATRPVVVAARKSAQTLAYQDYVSVVGGKDPVPKMDQNRFTEGLWAGVIEAATKDFETVAPSVAESIGMQADRWTRDAEWGQTLDAARKDDRIGNLARVDFQPPTCPWCTLLNSRGPVYLTTDSGAATLHEGDTCTLVMVPKGQKDYPGHEHTAEALSRYKDARTTAGTGKTSDILRELKNQGHEPPGTVRKNARAAVQKAAEDEKRSIQARIRTLENMNPKTASAIKYRDEQLARNQKQLGALEAHTNG